MNLRVKLWAGVFLLASAVAGVASSGEESDRAAEQQRLDQACEAARQEKLAPERSRFIEECVEKKQRPDRAACERFYADYGNQSGDRAPLYYDLPACVRAFEHQQDQP